MPWLTLGTTPVGAYAVKNPVDEGPEQVSAACAQELEYNIATVASNWMNL
jgi:hypothetical protein